MTDLALPVEAFTVDELLDRQELTVRCAFCKWEAHGPARRMIERAKRHRLKHGGRPEARRGPGTCRHHACSRAGVHEMHPGEWLCETHYEQHRANVAGRRPRTKGPDAVIRRNQRRPVGFGGRSET